MPSPLCLKVFRYEDGGFFVGYARRGSAAEKEEEKWRNKERKKQERPNGPAVWDLLWLRQDLL